jgi:hypothetical protein
LAHLRSPGTGIGIDLTASPRFLLQILNLTRTWVGSAEDALETDRGPDLDQARQSLAMTKQLLAALQEWSASGAVEDPDQSATTDEPDH